MSHLSPERIAALVDDTLTPIESAHMTTCAACTAEMAAQRKLSRLAAAASASFGAPSSDFNALLPRLRAEGIVDGADRRANLTRWAVRIAASFALVAAGAAAGRMTAGAPVLSFGAVSTTGASNVANWSTSFKTQEEAIQAMMASQQAYQNAAAFLAAQDTSQHFTGLNTDAYRTRLAALDEMAAATRSGLYKAPQDPLLNQYYLAFNTAREQTLQALSVSLPAKRQVGRY